MADDFTRFGAYLDVYVPKVQKQIVRKAIRAGSNALRASIKSEAKTNTSHRGGGNIPSLLARSIEHRVTKRPKPGSYRMYIRVKPNVEQFVSVTKGGIYNGREVPAGFRHYIPAALEFGHAKPGWGRARGKGRKDVRPFPFMKSGFDKGKGKADMVIAKELWRGIKAQPAFRS